MLAKVQGRRKTFITQSKGDFPVDPRHKILYAFDTFTGRNFC